MMQTAALAVVVLTGLYFAALGALSLLAPARATQFLTGFAETPFRHFVELAFRLVVGAAFVHHAPRTEHDGILAVFGWVLVVTTLGLMAVPWSWHRRFARRAVPIALDHLGMVAVASLLLGALVLGSLLDIRAT